MAKVYKIRRKSDGWFSTGGMSPVFNKVGKTWNNIGHLKNHLKLFSNYTALAYEKSECEIVTFELQEIEAKVLNMEDYAEKEKSISDRIII